MATEHVYRCDCCGVNINEHDTPIVFYMVAGHLKGGAELATGDVPQLVQHILEQPIPRIELHAHCVPAYLAHWLDEAARLAERAAAEAAAEAADTPTPAA